MTTAATSASCAPSQPGEDHPGRIRRHCTLWQWEGHYHLVPPSRAYVYERLQTDAPRTAAPFTCLVNTVVFYADNSYRHELCRCRHYNLTNASDTCVILPDGRWYQILPGKVVHHAGRWYMRWLCAANYPTARWLNAGWRSR